MKIAVVKLGSRISFNANDTSGGNGEARSIVNMLLGANEEVHVYTKILKKDNLIPEIYWHNIEDDFANVNDQGFDALLVINGSVNFFGGCEDRAQILNYNIMQNFRGQVLYAHCDPALMLKQLWPAIEKKPWGSAYNKSDICIDRGDIIVIAQPYNLDEMHKLYAKKNVAPIADIVHYPFEQFPMMGNALQFNPEPEWDLSYGGTMRGGKREDSMIKYYFDLPEDITCELFGKIEHKHFKPKKIDGLREPEYGKAIKYAEMMKKMNTAIAHVVIGDKQYATVEMLNQRTYESILASCVTFVDQTMDHEKRIYSTDKTLSDFLYVNDKQELIDRIRLLKQDDQARYEIVQAQFKAVGFDAQEYCDGFANVIKQQLRG